MKDLDQFFFAHLVIVLFYMIEQLASLFLVKSVNIYVLFW